MRSAVLLAGGSVSRGQDRAFVATGYAPMYRPFCTASIATRGRAWGGLVAYSNANRPSATSSDSGLRAFGFSRVCNSAGSESTAARRPIAIIVSTT